MDRIGDWVRSLDGVSNANGSTGSTSSSRPASSSSHTTASGNPPVFHKRPTSIIELSDSSSPLSVRSIPPSRPNTFTQPRPKPPAPPVYPMFNNNVNKPKPKPPLAPSTSHFNTAGPAPKTGSFATSTSAFKTAKQRAMEEMHSSAKVLGIPIGVPTNPTFRQQMQQRAAVAKPRDTADDEEAVLEAMANVNISNELSAADQEKELKRLIEDTMDMEDVDTSDGAPSGMTATLRPYQMLGLHWLKNREKGGKKSGGILGDDMGLGKTVQMIALMLANRATSKPKTTLIICPLSLMQQWKDEIEKHSDVGMRVKIHHGTGRETEIRRLLRYDVIITSYSTCASEWVDPKPPATKKGKGRAQLFDNDNDDDASEAGEAAKAKALKDCGPLFDAGQDGNDGFYRIILDEAHQIKNRNSRQHKACCALVAKYRWCLTGTPVQNEVWDLFSLFEFLGKVVSPLHQYSEFKAKIADPLKNKRAKVAMARLAVVLKSIMIRRTKTMLVDGKPIVTLPKRIIKEIKGPFLDNEEREFYTAVENKMQLKFNAYRDAGSAQSNMTSILILLLRMRQACSHPLLVLNNSAIDKDGLDPSPDTNASSSNALAKRAATPTTSLGDELDDLVNSLNDLAVEQKLCGLCSEPCKEEFCRSCQNEMDVYRGKELVFSTKIKRLLNVLHEIRTESPTRKTIVFSQFTSMFNLVEPFLKRGGFRYVRFDGGVKPAKRAEVLDAIKNDPRVTVILISIKAGSVGLNLTCCSRVVMMDLWWNPAIEAQAFDRAHRMGQKEDVVIYKITVDNTIEDRILTLQGQKAELAKACLEGGDFKAANKLSIKDLLHLFGDRTD